ncbi:MULTISPECIES: spore coat protein U domain-containing protein [Persephonella]|nr:MULTISPECIES: spore coat protein U domain-containing protein [Persephonella]
MRYVITVLFIIFSFNISFAVVKGGHSTCTADIEDLPFGNYDPFEVSVKRVPALLTVRCSGHRPVTYTVKLLGGNSPDPTKRYLYSPSTDEKLYYNIFINGGCVFGDGTGGTCVISGTVQPKHHGGVQEVKHTVIGVIPPMQNVKAANDYRDALIIQIEY